MGVSAMSRDSRSGPEVGVLTEAERCWLLTAAANRCVWYTYQQTVALVRERQDEQWAAEIRLKVRER